MAQGNPNPNMSGLTPFTSETAPKGRKNAGLSINEWRNAMAAYTRGAIEDILEDAGLPAAQLIAAREMLAAIAGDDKAVARVCDYTNGFAVATNNFNIHTDEPKTESERAEARDSVLARIRSRVNRTA